MSCTFWGVHWGRIHPVCMFVVGLRSRRLLGPGSCCETVYCESWLSLKSGWCGQRVIDYRLKWHNPLPTLLHTTINNPQQQWPISSRITILYYKVLIAIKPKPVVKNKIRNEPLQLLFRAREELRGAGYRTFISKIRLILKWKNETYWARNASAMRFEPRAQMTKPCFVVWALFCDVAVESAVLVPLWLAFWAREGLGCGGERKPLRLAFQAREGAGTSG